MSMTKTASLRQLSAALGTFQQEVAKSAQNILDACDQIPKDDYNKLGTDKLIKSLENLSNVMKEAKKKADELNDEAERIEKLEHIENS